MITEKDQARVLALTKEYWGAEVKNETFQNLKGKETGHRIAEYVDERTTAMLKEKGFTTAHERDPKNQPKPRSMGDVWLCSGGIYNPVNVKAGEADKNGQPNLVSLTKLLDALLNHRIDSYYLLIVKVCFAKKTANVYFVDMLDYLDFVTFDAGPGQLMLKEKDFYENAVKENAVKPVSDPTIQFKVDKLMDLLEDGHNRLFKNRQKTIDRLRTTFGCYDKSVEVNQGDLNLG